MKYQHSDIGDSPEYTAEAPGGTEQTNALTRLSNNSLCFLYTSISDVAVQNYAESRSEERER